MEHSAPPAPDPSRPAPPPASAPPAEPLPPPALWARTRPWLGPLSLVAGSVWDFATLRRIDRLSDNLLLLGYLVLLAGSLVLERRAERGLVVFAWARRWPAIVPVVTQFLFGSLFSAYLVYYSHSAGSMRGLWFVGLLLGLLLANELAERRLRGEWVRVPLFFLVAMSFLLFFLPVITGKLLGLFPAGLGALVATAGVLYAIFRPWSQYDAPPYRLGQRPLWGWAERVAPPLLGVLLLWLSLVGMRELSLIPPVPLSLAHIGVFHDVRRPGTDVELTYEPQWTWTGRAEYDVVFRRAGSAPVSCFSAVFAPNGMSMVLVHRWQRWDDGGWVDMDRVSLKLDKGGRDGGYRTWSRKQRSMPAGDWRVRVETEDGWLIGQVEFELRDEAPLAELVHRTY